MTRAVISAAIAGFSSLLLTAIFSQVSQPPAGAQPVPSYERGLAEMSHRDWEGAINSFTESIGFNMKNTDAYFKRGQCYYYAKDYAHAISDFNYLLGMQPRDAQALLWLGTACARLGRDDEAQTYYLRAMRCDPRLVKQFEQGQAQTTPQTVNPHNEGAVSAYQKAVQTYIAEKQSATESTVKSDISPAGIEPDTTMTEPEVRIEQLDAAIQSDPSNAALRFRRGLVNKKLGHLDKALADFSEAINLDPMKPRFYLARARLYHDQNQPDLSAADIKKAQSVDPSVPRHINFDEPNRTN